MDGYLLHFLKYNYVTIILFDLFAFNIILQLILCSQGLIVLNVASSGIASLLLPEGRIAHSTFSIPLVINDE